MRGSMTRPCLATLVIALVSVFGCSLGTEGDTEPVSGPQRSEHPNDVQSHPASLVSDGPSVSSATNDTASAGLGCSDTCTWTVESTSSGGWPPQYTPYCAVRTNCGSWPWCPTAVVRGNPLDPQNPCTCTCE